MNRNRLPPLHLIVGFEAAARLLSFKLAASELSLTPSAVSQRIRNLETLLGVRLFNRLVRGIELTPKGLEFEKEVRRILAELSRATQRFAVPRDRTYAIAMTSVVAHEMVIPNLRALEDAGGGLTVDIVTRTSMKTFTPDAADAGIRIGAGMWLGFEHRTIGPLTTAPLCAPALARRIGDWDDVFRHSLFCAKSRKAETLDSMRHPVTGSYHPKVVTFQTLAEAIRAAEAGLGLVGGMMPLMNNFVRQRRLRPVFNEPRATDERIAFIYRPDHPRRDELDSIYRWLVACYRNLPSPGTARVS